MHAPDSQEKDVQVSVCMITYNHERFVAQAIESVLMQEADFAYELVIGEDYSTDDTRRIVDEYARNYPGRIRPLLHEHNLGMMPNFVATLKACRGKYIALLEGDDYWTDPHKLQKQVDFLEVHADHAACFHRTYRLVEATGEVSIWRRTPRVVKPSYNLDEIIRNSFVPTPSFFFRRGLIHEFPGYFYTAAAGDWLLFVLLAQRGEIGFIDEAMSVYRVHDGGVYAGATITERVRIAASVFEALRTHLGPEYDRLIKAGVSDYFLDVAASSADRDDVSTAKAYLVKSILECPISHDMRILDKVVLMSRLYVSPVYRALKRLQVWLTQSRNLTSPRRT